MRNWLRSFLLLFVIVLLSGCAHVISKDLRVKADPYLTLRDVSKNPNAYQGKTVIWGGEIIKTTNQKDGSTLIEIFQLPLSRRGEPNEMYPSEGRFLVLAEKYLDPYLFKQGRKVTVAGDILGEEIRPLGEMDYRYPLLSGKQIYLWREYYYYNSPYYYRYYYYDPWWSYPYWWGFGFGANYHFHHHR
jgi:outer membrane lipoprotein